MRKYRVSALFRFLPALLWLCVPVAFVWKMIELITEATRSSGGSAITGTTALMALMALALAAFSIHMARKEFKDAQRVLKAEIAIGLPRRRVRRRRNEAPTRYPLAEPLRIKAREFLQHLQTAGVLQPGELAFEEFIDCAEELDEYVDLDIYDVGGILQALTTLHAHQFTNLAFFGDQVEVCDADMIEMVREFAQLSGQLERLGAISVKGIDGGKIAMAGRGEFPPNNALAEFELGARRYTVPFVMYSKNIPGGLMEGLAKVFSRPDDPRQFVSAYFSSAVAVTYLSAEKAAALNRSLPQEPFEPLSPGDLSPP